VNALPQSLQRRAQARHALIAQRRAQPRYLRVLGRFVEAGLLRTNEPAILHRKPIRVVDALWASEVEPRILELLPALLIKKPSFFEDASALPEDLERAVRALKRNRVPEPLRGIPGSDLARWVPRVGRKDKLPSRLRCFRLSAEDSQYLAHLARELDLNETEVMRRALRELAAARLAEDAPESGSPRRRPPRGPR
jgi:hypothetical protein